MRELAVRYSLTCRRPQPFEYLAFSSELATGLGLVVEPSPVEELLPDLSSRHHQILGIDEQQGKRLAAAILDDPNRMVGRVPERELTTLGSSTAAAITICNAA